MVKKKNTRRPNIVLNFYSNGGDTNVGSTSQTWGQQAKSAAKSAFNSQNLGSTLGNLGTSMGSIVNTGIQNANIADTSDIEENIQAAQNYKVSANNNDDLMSEWSTFTPLEEVSWKDIRGSSVGQNIGNTLSAIGAGASFGVPIGGPIGAIAGGIAGLGSAIGGWFGGNRRAKKKAEELNEQIAEANDRNYAALVNKARAIDTQNDLAALANYSSYGGPINRNYDLSYLTNMFKDGGGIHIKKANRGKFTDYCGGKVTSECIQRGLHSSNPTTRKRANFARNARKWKHANGGYLYYDGGNLHAVIPNVGQHGGNFSNGITIIDNGGTHEENPYEGIQIGIDNQGIPNLVEEGEVIYNDYVFSNRLSLSKDIKKVNKYRGNTFAEIAKNLQKESEERPNDPISKRGLQNSMARLQLYQEQVRMNDNKDKKYSKGGYIDKPPFEEYYKTVPITKNDTINYNLRRAYELAPYEDMVRFAKEPEFHLNSVYEDPKTGIYNFVKSKNHPTVNKELEWFYSPKAKSFRDNYYLDKLGDYYKYIPKNNKKAKGGNLFFAGGDEYDSSLLYGEPINLEEAYNNWSQNQSGVGNNKPNKTSWLRYAPVAGSLIGLGQNIFSKPDYSSVNAILDAADDINNYTPVKYTPIGNYLTYKPLDRNYYINKLNSQAGATRRAIMNTSNLSRNAALLAADYNATGKIGDLARQAEEYNLAQKERVQGFNRQTNMINSEMGLKAAMANQEAALKAKSARLNGVTQAMSMKDAIDSRRNASISANLTNLFDSLGNIGIDAYNRADRDMLINSGIFGVLSQKPQEWSDKRWEDYKKTLIGTGYSKGGKLKKRRGGLTY